ncbi:hypothetical protein EZV73_23290 [Acidaminobacter sp. JC074]|uniref:hypothetical protein n=1 Tax=Acidaminobacter sp. JC074 TaxID=2530199 RepID=UPI001F0F3EE6|nr:hypothetical protein [Acidaminobacter sp. JC074]MCH4890525.1 hypothetical protein [Acidaminobacter sp. JC074]
MYINMKRIYRYGVLLVIGLSLFFYGLIQMTIEDHSMKEPSDAEIIERARELGMISINEYYLEKDSEDE